MAGKSSADRVQSTPCTEPQTVPERVTMPPLSEWKNVAAG